MESKKVKMKNAMNEFCKTKHPIVLIHGAGFRDLRWPVYWGRIPAALEAEGAKIYYGLQDSWGSVETNAEAIAARIDEILLETGAEKVNLIAHSKVGLDARMAISTYGYGGKVASLTTIATPHRGSRTIDRLIRMPHAVWGLAAFAVNNWIRIVGDKEPDFLRLCEGFTTESMRRFNEQNPNVAGVFYQSYCCVMAHPLSDINLSTANFVLNRLEGPNDGLVSLKSARWGEKTHVLRSNGFRGVSHLDAIDLRRYPLSRKTGDGVSDIVDVYLKMVSDLKKRGY